jgi:pectinesterase
VAQDISFKNTAGAANGQAVALKSDSEFSVFYRVGIYGYQDSLCANLNRQFYKECTISGTVDFIFGYASAIFQNCQILVKKGGVGTKHNHSSSRITRNNNSNWLCISVLQHISRFRPFTFNQFNLNIFR